MDELQSSRNSINDNNANEADDKSEQPPSSPSPYLAAHNLLQLQRELSDITPNAGSSSISNNVHNLSGKQLPLSLHLPRTNSNNSSSSASCSLAISQADPATVVAQVSVCSSDFDDEEETRRADNNRVVTVIRFDSRRGTRFFERHLGSARNSVASDVSEDNAAAVPHRRGGHAPFALFDDDHDESRLFGAPPDRNGSFRIGAVNSARSTPSQVGLLLDEEDGVAAPFAPTEDDEHDDNNDDDGNDEGDAVRNDQGVEVAANDVDEGGSSRNSVVLRFRVHDSDVDVFDNDNDVDGLSGVVVNEKVIQINAAATEEVMRIRTLQEQQQLLQLHL